VESGSASEPVPALNTSAEGDGTRSVSIHLPYELGRYDARRISYRVRNLISLSREALMNVRKPRIMDIGCGRCEFIRAAKEQLGAEVIGLDMDPVCVDFAKRFGSTFQGELSEVFAANANDLIGSVDLVVSSHTLEHMRDPIDAVEIMKKITRRHILLALPNPHNLPMIVKAALFNRLPEVNKGHYYCWDAPHLGWFLSGQLNLEIVRWGTDWVQLAPRAVASIRALTPIVGVLEGRVVPHFFPRLAESLIVLCRKPSAEGQSQD
jgi:SAM-dependent methyltransferase